LIDDSGELPSEGQGPSQVTGGKFVALDVDHLVRIDVSTATETRCKIE